MPLAVAVRAPPPAPTVPHDPLAHAAGMPPPVDASGQAYIRVAPSGPGGWGYAALGSPAL